MKKAYRGYVYEAVNPYSVENNPLKGGVGDGVEVDEKALEKGASVEREHSSSPEVAADIARDHIAEFPDYYEHLEDMENELRRDSI